jgi:chemotaxis protein CheD
MFNGANDSKKITVPLGEMRFSTDPKEVLVTYALGSCLGLSLYDPIARIGGLIHCQLPLSSSNPEKAAVNPCLFVDTGVTALLRTALEQGARKDRMILKVAGGSQSLTSNEMFNIGRKNYIVLRKLLWKNNLLIDTEHVGGILTRTMFLYMSDGSVRIKAQGMDIRL